MRRIDKDLATPFRRLIWVNHIQVNLRLHQFHFQNSIGVNKINKNEHETSFLLILFT